ncbi:hypothetical protein [Vibrio phage PhiImVa-1]|nr:hypothetical protein [Vibrio phage PhiImVa-1]
MAVLYPEPTNQSVSSKPQITIGVKWKNVDGALNVYCGRGSVFGNPFPITDSATRDEVCDKYEDYFHQEANREGSELNKGMRKLLEYYQQGNNINLQCYCEGKRCHTETIKRSLERVSSTVKTEPTQQKVIIAGGRDFFNTDYMRDCLLQLVEEGWLSTNPIILCGMAKGTDLTAYDLCKYEFELEVWEYPADWHDMSEPCVKRTNRYGEYNALAGIKRNDEMAADANMLIAFWDGKSTGTKNMIETMQGRGFPVKIFYY